MDDKPAIVLDFGAMTTKYGPTSTDVSMLPDVVSSMHLSVGGRVGYVFSVARCRIQCRDGPLFM